jgi:hypothetical protein
MSAVGKVVMVDRLTSAAHPRRPRNSDSTRLHDDAAADRCSRELAVNGALGARGESYLSHGDAEDSGSRGGATFEL